MQDNKSNNILTNDHLLRERVIEILRSNNSGYTHVDSREDLRFESAILQGVVSNLSIEEIADMCYYSVSTFKRRFNERYQVPPHRWMLSCRMNIACEILRTTRASTSDIATRCGFVNVSHFIACFRRHHGMTPSQYRRDNITSIKQINIDDE